MKKIAECIGCNGLSDVVSQAIKIKNLHSLNFVTIWRTNDEYYGFNFEKKEVGHIEHSYGDKREVVGIR